MRKMKYQRRYFLWVMIAAFGTLLAGCAGTSTPSNFYLLRALPEAEDTVPTVGGKDGLSVLVGPITLPAYLDRTQVVTIFGDNELRMDEFSRWAEPLKDNFYRVLVENLSLLLNTPRIYSYDRRGVTPADFQIIIDVTRFDSAVKGDAYLTAFWTAIGKDGNSHEIERKSVFRAAAPAPDLKGVVAAQNRTLTRFSREIATAIRSLKR
jgi:uncharacterized lipoprotein YmbA